MHTSTVYFFTVLNVFKKVLGFGLLAPGLLRIKFRLRAVIRCISLIDHIFRITFQ